MSEELQKHTLHLRRGDMDRLREMFPTVPVSLVIRRLVATTVDRFEKNSQVDRIEGLDL